MRLKVYLYQMGKRLKIVLISLVSLLVLVILGVVVAQKVMTSKIENFLANSLPEHIKVHYEELHLSILSGTLRFENPSLESFGKTTDSLNLKVIMESFEVDDFSFYNYLFNDRVDIDAITLKAPKITYYHNKLIDSRSYQTAESTALKQDVAIHRLNVLKGDLKIYDVQSDSLMFKTDHVDFHLLDIKTNEAIAKEKIPFHSGNYGLTFSNLFYSLSAYDNLEIHKSKISNVSTEFEQLKLYTKYSKQQLSRIIPVERDHYDLTIDAIVLHHQEFGYQQDSVFYFKSPKVEFVTPVFKIYRDKLVKDDETIKYLYSKMLRQLKFDLTLSEVFLKNSTIEYSEKVNPESSAGMISFTKLNADIQNVGNTYPASEKTNLDIEAIFMKSTPIKVNWYFDVHNVNDHFVFKADVGRLPAQDLNSFSEPNLKVKFEGELVKTYFTIDGNFQNSNVDLRTNYEDFKVAVLDKEGKGKNKFLSTIANLFIKKDTDKSDDNFREGMKTDVERDKTKSVFNFLWLNARAGLLSAMTGNGKK